MTESWPPVGAALDAFGGDWQKYRAFCYGEYYTQKPVWPADGKRFAIKRQPEVDGQCHTFWHIVTEGSDEASRVIVPERCERVGWPRLILDEYAATYPARSSARIVWWKTARSGQTRVVIALADFSYVVVIDERADYVLLWTAYPVEYQSRRKKLRAEFEAYWANG